MSIFVEAGIFAYVSLGLFVLGLILVVRRPENAKSIASLMAPAILAAGLIGAGTGQRLVDKYLDSVTDPAQKVVVLSAGTREATANHLLAGLMALALVGIGAGVSRASPRSEA